MIFTANTLPATDKRYNEMTLNGQLTGLDPIYDAAILSFQYSTEIDGTTLVNPIDVPEHRGIFEEGGNHTETFTAVLDTFVDLEHMNLHNVVIQDIGGGGDYTKDTDYDLDLNNGSIKVLSTGTMAATDYEAAYDYGVNSVKITGLDMGQTYYYQANIESVAWDSQEMVEKAFNYEGFVYSVSDNKSAMSNLLSTDTGRTKFITSPYFLDAVFKTNNGINFWDYNDDISSKAGLEMDNNRFGYLSGLKLRADYNVSISFSINLDNINTLSFYEKAHNSRTPGGNDLSVSIDGSQVFTTSENNTTFENRVVDLSSYNGICNLTFHTGGSGAYQDAHTTISDMTLTP